MKRRFHVLALGTSRITFIVSLRKGVEGAVRSCMAGDDRGLCDYLDLLTGRVRLCVQIGHYFCRHVVRIFHLQQLIFN